LFLDSQWTGSHGVKEWPPMPPCDEGPGMLRVEGEDSYDHIQ